MEQSRNLAAEQYIATEENERKCLEAIHSVIQRERLSGTSKILFNTLFPEKEGVELHHHGYRETHPTSRFTPEEKKLAEIAYNELGLSSIKPEKRPKGRQSPHDEPDFRIAYTASPSSYMSWLNSLPILDDMKGVTQVDVLPGEELKKMDRKKHSKILGAAVIRDIVRMAIKTPDLFQKQVERDLEFFRKMDYTIPADILKGKNNIAELTKKIDGLKTNGSAQKIDENGIAALASTIEYAKYIALFAYLHDSQTPALADVVMKAKARFPGQADIHYSEDEELKKNIQKIIESPVEGVHQLSDTFHLSESLIRAQVQSVSEENDPTLCGMLVKNKRKQGFVEKGGSVFLAGKPAFDRDQVAGTTANMEDQAALHLPGGFIHSYKNDEASQVPIGSFTERIQLLAYVMAQNMSKEDLTNELRTALDKQGFKKTSVQDEILQRIAITAEEFEYGPNFMLRELQTGEIVPVALNPGALKRLLLSFATLTYFHYQGDRRAAYEGFIHNLLTTVHGYQKQHNLVSPYENPEMTSILDVFVERSDRGALALLTRDYPIIAHVIEKYLNKGVRVTEGELPTLFDTIQKEGDFAFLARAKFFAVDQKEGTLVEDELDEAKTPTPYLEIIRKKKAEGKREDNPQSLPNKLDAIAQQLQNEKLYYVIRVTRKDIEELKQVIGKTNTRYQNIFTRALRYWTIDLSIDNQHIINPLKTEFPPIDDDEDIMWVREAQEKEDKIFRKQNSG